MKAPVVSRLILSLFLPRSLREPVLGDLEEQHARRASVDGPAAARRWYRAQAWSLLRNLAPLSHEPTTLTPPRSPMQGFGADLRFALRLFSTRPTATILAIVTLSLGIGATTAIFSVVKPVLFESLPYPASDRLAMIYETDGDGSTTNLGYATFDDLRRETTSFSGVAAAGTWQTTILGQGEPILLDGLRVTHDYFAVLGVAPALGRDFSAEEDQPGVARVVILSHRLWRDRFGADPAILGRDISLSGNPATVIGVMPADFENLLGAEIQLWTPLRYASQSFTCRTCRHLRVIGRLGDEVSPPAAKAELSATFARLTTEFPRDYGRAGVAIEPLATAITKRVRPTLYTLFGAVSLILIIACVNVANLLLGQAIQRRQEFAVRMALGSGRHRLVRQVLIESGLLGLASGACAVGLTFAAIGTLRTAAAAQLPRAATVGVDWQVLGFGAVVGILAGIGFGLLPAFSSLEAAATGLRQGARTTARRKARRALIVAEVGLASVVVIAATLLVESMNRLLAVDSGFDADRLLTATIVVTGPHFATDSATWRYFRAAQEAGERVPGVERAALVSQLPLGGNFDTSGLHLEDNPRDNPGDAPPADRYGVSPGYFETMGIPLREGRLLTEHDRGGPLVAVINGSIAEREFPGRSPIGRRLKLGGPGGPWRTIVGVVGDVRHHGLDQPQTLQAYVPNEQWGFADRTMVMVARTAADPAAAIEPLRAAIRSIDRDPTIERVQPMTAVIGTSTAARRMVLRLFQLFAFLALTLAAIGIYGVMSGGVAERAREFGIRAALGADGERLTRSVLGETIRLGLLGVAIGVVVSIALAPAFRVVLYEVTATSPLAYGATGVILLTVAAAAAWIPARRAARHDPVVALRAE